MSGNWKVEICLGERKALLQEKSFTALKKRKKENRRNGGVNMKTRGFLKPQEWMICFHHYGHAERLGSPTESLLPQFKLEGADSNGKYDEPCLGADRTFTLEALNADQTNICKKPKPNQTNCLVNLLNRQRMG